MEKTDRKSQAYSYLKTLITEDTLAQGAPLRETEIAEQLHMSRTPIREALRELEAEGLVISYPARGTFVAALTPYDVEEIYELRTLFELYALEKAFPRITDEDLKKAEDKFLEVKENFDYEQFHAADRWFHQMILDKCGSRRVLTFMKTLNAQIERIRHYSSRNKLRPSSARLAEHLHIIECIRSRSLEASKDALLHHLRNVSDAAIETCRVMAAESLAKQG